MRERSRQPIDSKQRQIIRRIILQQKQMQDAGQLEVVTTPYTHPILPLLADTNVGRVARPEMSYPNNGFAVLTLELFSHSSLPVVTGRGVPKESEAARPFAPTDIVLREAGMGNRE